MFAIHFKFHGPRKRSVEIDLNNSLGHLFTILYDIV